MVCGFVYNFKFFNFQIGHQSDFNRKFSSAEIRQEVTCPISEGWNQIGNRFWWWKSEV